MAGEQSTGARFTATRDGFIGDLERIGPPMTTPVFINGRQLLLDAAIKLIESLPEAATLARRGNTISVTPDPFTAQLSLPPIESEAAGLVARLLECQDAADREQAQRRPGWWR